MGGIHCLEVVPHLRAPPGQAQSAPVPTGGIQRGDGLEHLGVGHAVVGVDTEPGAHQQLADRPCGRVEAQHGGHVLGRRAQSGLHAAQQGIRAAVDGDDGVDAEVVDQPGPRRPGRGHAHLGQRPDLCGCPLGLQPPGQVPLGLVQAPWETLCGGLGTDPVPAMRRGVGGVAVEVGEGVVGEVDLSAGPAQRRPQRDPAEHVVPPARPGDQHLVGAS